MEKSTHVSHKKTQERCHRSEHENNLNIYILSFEIILLSANPVCESRWSYGSHYNHHSLRNNILFCVEGLRPSLARNFRIMYAEGRAGPLLFPLPLSLPWYYWESFSSASKQSQWHNMMSHPGILHLPTKQYLQQSHKRRRNCALIFCVDFPRKVCQNLLKWLQG